MVVFLLSLLLVLHGTVSSEKCACLHWTHVQEERCMELAFFENLIQKVSIDTLEISSITIEKKDVCNNLTEESRSWFSGSIDVTHNSDGSHSYGGSVNTPLGGVSGHVHTDANGKVTGGDGGVSAGGGLVSGGVHGSYDKGKGGSLGVHGSVGVPGLSVGDSVDVDSHKTVSVGGSATLGENTVGGNVNSKGETSTSIGSSVPVGKRDEDLITDDEDVDDKEPRIGLVKIEVMKENAYPVVDSEYVFY